MDIITAIKNLDLQFVKNLLANQRHTKSESHTNMNENNECSESKQLLPLHVAAETGCIEMLKLLLQHGLDINETDHKGSTPLEIAVFYGHFDAVNFLLQQGADIKDKKGAQNIFTTSYNFVGHHCIKLKGLFVKRENDKKNTTTEPSESINNETSLLQPCETSQQSEVVIVTDSNIIVTDSNTIVTDINNTIDNDSNNNTLSNVEVASANNINTIEQDNQQNIVELPQEISSLDLPLQTNARRNSILKPYKQSTEPNQANKRVQYLDDIAPVKLDGPVLEGKRKEALMIDAERKRSILYKRRKSTQKKHSVGRKLR